MTQRNNNQEARFRGPREIADFVGWNLERDELDDSAE
jgi:hypothetical protein